MKPVWQILNIASVILALVANFIVGAQIINVPSIGEISDRYSTILTPATYAFSIWSVIYLLLIVLAVYQARDIFAKLEANDLPQKLGPYFILTNIGNALWTYVFVSGYIGLSVLILLSMVISLFMLIKRFKIALYDAPVSTILFVWWPLLLYTGWVLVASVVNIASWLASRNIEITPAIASVALVALCNLLLILLFTRNVRELVLASTWGIVAITGRLIQTSGELTVTVTSIAVSAILLASMAFHACLKRKTNIFLRVLR